MRMMQKAGLTMAAMALALAGLAGAAGAQEKQLSEDAVRKYMDYAWSMTPAKFTRRDGKTIEIDKKQRDKVMVPIDVGREIIMAARMTAYAQACELEEDQLNNYRSLMRREEAKSKWSEQQMIFINQLHLTTVMLLAGTIKITEQQDGKEVELQQERVAPRVQKPTDAQCKQVREQIATYVKAGPALAPIDTAAARGAPAGVAQTGAPATTGATPPKKP